MARADGESTIYSSIRVSDYDRNNPGAHQTPDMYETGSSRAHLALAAASGMLGNVLTDLTAFRERFKNGPPIQFHETRGNTDAILAQVAITQEVVSGQET